MDYRGDSEYAHGSEERLGVLVVNLGTPDAPETAAVRRYLREFLWDPRVIELPRPLWWLLLNGVILRIRPRRSARAYQTVWTDEGSPLLVHTRALAEGIAAELERSIAGPSAVEVGMTYGNPSIASALERLRERGCRRLVVLPLYPQYSGTTTGSVFDRVTQALSSQRWVPELRFINAYHDESLYVEALAARLLAHQAEYGAAERVLFSFHGIPKRYFLNGDPYHCQSLKTARLVAERAGLEEGRWQLSFQSRVGREEWLRPYTDETLEAWGAEGVPTVDVMCPGFACDCLETLEEIAEENRERFEHAGGGELRYVPALNAGDDHVALLATLIRRHAGGWPETSASVDRAALDTACEATRQRALAAGAQR